MNYAQETKNSCQAVRISACEDGEEVGHAWLYLVFNDLHNEPYGLVEDIFVEEKYRGRGVGGELLKMIIAEAKARGCYKLIANSRYTRNEVHQWYLKNGFEDYGKEFKISLR